MHKEVVAILLAGGKGSRLKELTDTHPKPALHFGGKYRIIDFALSNCTNSGIDTIGIITQYEPIELTSYIGSGSAWDLDVLNGGVTVLPPYTSKQQGFYWQKGTAHAVYQHLNYLDLYQPKYVLILSSDHVYKMDYSEIIAYHIEKKADLTISSVKVNHEDAKRFGILTINENNKVTSFEEKPDNPTSFLASQGIYVFNYQILKSLLYDMSYQSTAEIDFAKHIIPHMIKHFNVYTYLFNGYWQDIGTIYSLWKANMDLIDDPHLIELGDNKWRIFSNTIHLPGHHVYKNAKIKNSLISEGSIIYGNVYHSVLSHSVIIGENSTIDNTVIMPRVRIGENCLIKNAIVKMNVKIPNKTHLVYDSVKIISEEVIS
ncbi:glucose-1-phosphate adenylyltransferase [Mycoplasmatota bacterium]|nr:glucose-1-phosphate adenylyltransferase [Mycoplasmatota bacterium]